MNNLRTALTERASAVAARPHLSMVCTCVLQYGAIAAQVTVGCGTVCVFHVGGYTTSLARDAVPRWEFFIADCPHAEPLDDRGRRQPFDQIAQSEALAMPGDVIVSQEVAEVRILCCSPCTTIYKFDPFLTAGSNISRW